jgi:hypothetical protein
VAVFRQGRIEATLEGERITSHEIMTHASGGAASTQGVTHV